MPSTREGIARAMEARSPIDIDGTRFTLSLLSARDPLPHETQAIHLAFTAVNGPTRHNGQLHLGLDRYTDDEIADLAVQTIRDIAAGELPPDTISML